MKQIIKENITKNLLIVLIIWILYTPIKSFLTNSISDKALAGDTLVAVSIFAVIACFGNFAFTYEGINPNNTFQRYLAHITTGLLMVVIGISLVFSSILTAIIIGEFIIIDLLVIIIYAASVGYDFWDVYRIKN
tara:strand:+ start:301 stop:702 length:402 start_codon:yes stop_codon:yes gene_type:complete